MAIAKEKILVTSSIEYHQICAELYKRKKFDVQCKTPWGVHAKQLLTLQLLSNDNITNVGYGGSARSGKSWIASEYLIMSCIAYPGTGWGLARKELKNLKRTTLLTLFKVIEKYKLENGRHFKYNQQDQIITFYNRSQIFLIDTAYQPTDPLFTRFGGYELTGLVIDESNETTYDAVEILSGRTGFRLNIDFNLPPRTLEMFNPDKGHVYNRFYLPYKNNNEAIHQKFIKALPSDNPDPAVKIWIEQQIASSSEITIERLVNGNFDYDESKDRLIDQNAANDYFSNEFVLAQGHKYITADIARLGRDSTMIRVWHGLRVIERIEIFKNTMTEAADAIRQLANKHGIGMSSVIADEDGVGGGVVDILNCYGFVANKRPIGKTNYANLKAQCTFTMAGMINAGRVYEPVGGNQTLMAKIKQEFDWVRERDIDIDGKLKVVSKDEIKQAIRRSPDEWDSICMRAYFELGSSI